jgi:hypothetical protein
MTSIDLTRDGKTHRVKYKNNILLLRTVCASVGVSGREITVLIRANATGVSVFPGRNDGQGLTFENAGRMDQWDLGNLHDRRKDAIFALAATFRRVNRAIANGHHIGDTIHIMSDADAEAASRAVPITEEAKEAAHRDPFCSRGLQSAGNSVPVPIRSSPPLNLDTVLEGGRRTTVHLVSSPMPFINLSKGGKTHRVNHIQSILHLRAVCIGTGLRPNDVGPLAKANSKVVAVFPGPHHGYGVTFEEAGRMDLWDLENLNDRKKKAVQEFAATFRRVNRAIASGHHVGDTIHIMSDADAKTASRAVPVTEEAKEAADNDPFCARGLQSAGNSDPVPPRSSTPVDIDTEPEDGRRIPEALSRFFEKQKLAQQRMDECVAEERRLASEGFDAAMEEAQSVAQATLDKAVAEERRLAQVALDKAVAEERRLAQTSLDKTVSEERRLAQKALDTAVAEERRLAKGTLAAAMLKERRLATVALAAAVSKERRLAQDALAAALSNKQKPDTVAPPVTPAPVEAVPSSVELAQLRVQEVQLLIRLEELRAARPLVAAPVNPTHARRGKATTKRARGKTPVARAVRARQSDPDFIPRGTVTEELRWSVFCKQLRGEAQMHSCDRVGCQVEVNESSAVVASAASQIPETPEAPGAGSVWIGCAGCWDTHRPAGYSRVRALARRGDCWSQADRAVSWSRCFVCSDNVDYFAAQVGHDLAHALGGSLELSNLQPVCTACNRFMGETRFSEARATHQAALAARKDAEDKAAAILCGCKDRSIRHTIRATAGDNWYLDLSHGIELVALIRADLGNCDISWISAAPACSGYGDGCIRSDIMSVALDVQ